MRRTLVADEQPEHSTVRATQPNQPSQVCRSRQPIAPTTLTELGHELEKATGKTWPSGQRRAGQARQASRQANLAVQTQRRSRRATDTLDRPKTDDPWSFPPSAFWEFDATSRHPTQPVFPAARRQNPADNRRRRQYGGDGE
ncbi:hypothetical protein LZ30DRAFT_212000 [Colletotrichum cereale]|nr:hypothetical protein LZ30DRAFT_212000 [Colletotrichum cereale]